MDIITILRCSYLGAALAVLLVSVTPPLRDRFLAYGARASSSAPSAEKEKVPAKRQGGGEKKDVSLNIVSKILAEVADWQVPHDWFWLFYFFSVVLSAFWPAEALYLRGPLYMMVVDLTPEVRRSMTFEQVKITWAMMLVQGGRRMYETLTLAEVDEFGYESKTGSKMWGGHLVLGLLFYVATSVAVWVEGVPAIQSHTLLYRDLIFNAPTFRTIFSVLIFILASGFQHDCHTYLAYLKKTKSKADDGKENSDENTYKMPVHPAFQPFVCPHYTAECFIYVSLAFVSAPEGAWVNWTMASALAFVVVNLGVTAEVTRQWYVKRFGEEAMKGKWRMIPPIY